MAAPIENGQGGYPPTPKVPPKSAEVLQYEADLAKAIALSKEEAEMEKALAISMETAKLDDMQRKILISPSYANDRSVPVTRTGSQSKPARPPQPHRATTPEAQPPNLIEFDPKPVIPTPSHQPTPLTISGTGTTYQQDLLEIFGSQTSPSTPSSAGSTTGVSMDKGFQSTTAAQSSLSSSQDPWNLLSQAINPVETKSLPNSPKLSHRNQTTMSKKQVTFQSNVPGLYQSKSGSDLSGAFHAQVVSQSQQGYSSSSAFMKYAPGLQGTASQSWDYRMQGVNRIPMNSSSTSFSSHSTSQPHKFSQFPSTALPSGVIAPVPRRPQVSFQQPNVPQQAVPSIPSPSSSAAVSSFLSTSAPSKTSFQTWQNFEDSSFAKPTKVITAQSSVTVSTKQSSNKHFDLGDKSKTSNTKQVFVWTGKGQSKETPAITVTTETRREPQSDTTDSSMDDILREFDVLETNRPPVPPRPPSPLQSPSMIRLSCSDSNIAGNVASWIDFDPLHKEQEKTTSDGTAPDSPPSYEESQQRKAATLPPSYAESQVLTQKSTPSTHSHSKASLSDDSPIKRPLTPPKRPPPPKSPTRSKSVTPPPRPKSPTRSFTVSGSPRPTSKPEQVTRSRPSTWRPISFCGASTTDIQAERIFFGDGLFDLAEEKDEESTAFCESIASFRSHYEYSNTITNPGHVISPIFVHPFSSGFESSVKLVVHSRHASKPITFTCDVETSVQHIISQAVYMLTNEINDPGDGYMLKVLGLAEYLCNDTLLGDYEYVQDCIKFEKDVQFVLQYRDEVNRELARTDDDDTNDILVTSYNHLFEKPITTAVSTQGMTVLLEAFRKECDKLKDSASDPSMAITPNKVIQTVKAMCATLATVETNDITRMTGELKSASYLQVNGTIRNLTVAVHSLIDMYCKAFDTGHTALSVKEPRPPQPVTTLHDELSVRIASVHRLPLQWKSKFDHFTLTCGAYYGGKQLCRYLTTKTKRVTTSFFDKIVFDQVFTIGMQMNKLPRETRLCFTLFGTSVSSESKHPSRKPLGWVAVSLFNFKSVMLSGSHLLGLWPDDRASPIGTCASNLLHTHSIILQVDFPNYGGEVHFPPVERSEPTVIAFDNLDGDDQNKLNAIFERDSLTRLSETESQLLWSKRHYLHNKPSALPWVLRVAESWDWSSLDDIYCMLDNWVPLAPVDAMQLLHPQFADGQVSAMAVKWIRSLADDELCDYLPQLVQALKYENYHDSALARFLLERALTSVRIAHFLYWHLKDNLTDQQFSQRFQMVLGAMLSTCGQALRDQFQQQDEFMNKLSEVAEIVKKHKDSVRQVILHRRLEPVAQKYTKNLRLPLSPSLDVGQLKVKSCSYFTSFTVPLRLIFQNTDPIAEEIAVMYKAGEDIRQDMLTLQMIGLMDKLWLQRGLDLRMITFRCMATGQNRGLVELIPDCETLRKIQVERGLTGSFKDKPLADWLQKYNPTEAEYQKAVDNFIYSCAGYCVATYVLGIGDRHNDNIMVTQTGHMFHIDFGKFLGNAQMFGNFKRDRTPFVLTSDMAYVINGGDKPSSRFHDFVDLCCQAFNIVRSHANLFFNLFGLMLNSGIAALSQADDIKYVHNALKPSASNAEATAMFTRLIEASVGAKSTQINFFIHNLAQLKFHGASNETGVLSFSPKTYTREGDGKIESAMVFGYQKRYNPDKHYMYIIKVSRVGEKEPSFIFRKFSEFHELDEKLSDTFPRIRLPPLSSTRILGRTHVKQVAEKRKIEIERWLGELLHMAPEISECDLVYTFFHPMLRDERDVDMITMVKPKESTLERNQPKSGQIGGEVKVSLHYKNGALVIMVKHVKDLIPPTDAGPPDPYVKLYLLPDPSKITKRKTKIARKTLNPTYNEMLIYNVPLNDVMKRTLQITVWNCDYLKENDFMGAVYIPMETINLSQETEKWYKLEAFQRVV
ncbi:phosphatidylinositol 4-phosphate 3-kinase C2 domain-containing subunit beta-like [Glandiceps talaboti]